MRRTTAPLNSATLPDITAHEDPGYYKDRAGLTPGTTPSAADLNIMQEELVGLATLKGATLDDTGADRGQCADAVRAVRAIETSETSALGDGVTNVSTLDNGVIISSATIAMGSGGGFAASASSGLVNGGSSLLSTLDAQAQGTRTASVASYGGNHPAGSTNSAALASTDSGTGADSDQAAIVAGSGCAAGAGMQLLLAASALSSVSGSNCAGIGVANSTAGGAGPVVGQVALASSFLTPSATNFSVQGGYDASAPAGPTWRIESVVGNVTIDGSFVDTGADFAEMIANGDATPHAPGRLLVRKGAAVHLAQPGDRIAGFVSTNPTIVGNEHGLSWQGRYLRDEWNRRTGERNPDYDPARAVTSRRDRPAEWTCVGLTGQGLIAVDATVRPDDDVVAGADGIGTRGEWVGRGRQVECMEIVSPFDAAVGYAIARCLVA